MDGNHLAKAPANDVCENVWHSSNIAASLWFCDSLFLRPLFFLEIFVVRALFKDNVLSSSICCGGFPQRGEHLHRVVLSRCWDATSIQFVPGAHYGRCYQNGSWCCLSEPTPPSTEDDDQLVLTDLTIVTEMLQALACHNCNEHRLSMHTGGAMGYAVEMALSCDRIWNSGSEVICTGTLLSAMNSKMTTVMEMIWRFFT